MPAPVTYDSRGVFVTVDSQGDFGSVAGQTRISGVTSLSGPNLSATEFDVTDFSSEAMERRPGLPNYGEVSITAFENGGAIWRRTLQKMFDDQDVRTFEIEVTQRTIQAAATNAATRGITIAAGVGDAAAIVTFSGSNYGTNFDVQNDSRISEGAVILSSNVAYVLGQRRSATTRDIFRLDATAVSAVTTAATFSVVRPRTLSTFQAYVSSMSPSYEVNAVRTIEIGLMISGAVSSTRTATSA